MREDYRTPTVTVTVALMEQYRNRKDLMKELGVKLWVRHSEAMDRVALGAHPLAWQVMLNEILRNSARRDHRSGSRSGREGNRS